ncbi:IS30 family transposase [Ruminococcus sp.]|uniref:IS30 family transposase n=1 Tax=Ruminococcus sp. TaxID=41978 RepID=UPI0025D5D7E8|nr:IS30 family transposase [Ruminococcus sp.]
MVCTKTLYNYVDLGLLPIKNIDLPEKTGRKKKSTIVRKNKRVFGNSIEERPKEIEKRNEFGHWEIDTVVGTKDESEPSVLTIVERQTRMSLWFKIKAHTSEAVTEALNKLVQSFADKAALIFKTIKGDNGSEFAQIAELEGKGLQIYFTYPYSSWEKEQTSVTIKCSADLFQKAKRFPITQLMTSCSFQILSTTYQEKS